LGLGDKMRTSDQYRAAARNAYRDGGGKFPWPGVRPDLIVRHPPVRENRSRHHNKKTKQNIVAGENITYKFE